MFAYFGSFTEFFKSSKVLAQTSSTASATPPTSTIVISDYVKDVQDGVQKIGSKENIKNDENHEDANQLNNDNNQNRNNESEGSSSANKTPNNNHQGTNTDSSPGNDSSEQ